MTALLAVKIATAIAQIVILAVGIPIIIRNLRQAEKSRAEAEKTLARLRNKE